MKAILSREPVLTLALAQTALALIVAFGVQLTAEQTGALLAFTAAALGWATRQRVSPVDPPTER